MGLSAASQGQTDEEGAHGKLLHPAERVTTDGFWETESHCPLYIPTGDPNTL